MSQGRKGRTQISRKAKSIRKHKENVMREKRAKKINISKKRWEKAKREGRYQLEGRKLK